MFMHPILYHQSVRGLYCFFIGCMIYEFYTEENYNSIIDLLINIVIKYVYIISVVVLLLYNKFDNLNFVFGFLVSPILIIVFLKSNTIKKISNIKILQYIGSISTSLYILHFCCYQFIRIISEIFNLQKYYDTEICYIITIIFIGYISHLSYTHLEPRINKFWLSLKEGDKG